MRKWKHLQILQKVSNGNCYGTTVLVSSNQTTFVLSLRPQFSGYIMPLKNLVLSTQLSEPPPKNFTDFKSTQSEYCKNYSMVFSLNLFFFFLQSFTCNLRVIFGTKLHLENIVRVFYEASQYFCSPALTRYSSISAISVSDIPCGEWDTELLERMFYKGTFMAGFLKKLSSCQFLKECFGQAHGLPHSKCVEACQAL